MSLTDDNPTAFLILMRVAHVQYQLVEAAIISYEILLALAKICDKYDTITLIGPWIDKWLKPCELQAVEKSYMGFEGLAFVAWTFGKPALFGNIAHHLVADMTFDSEDNLKNQGRLVDSTMPPGLIGKSSPSQPHMDLHEKEWLKEKNAETIKSFRDEKITNIINLCVPQINQYIALARTRRTRCIDEASYQSREELYCDSLNVGNLFLHLSGLGLCSGLGLWPDQVNAKNSTSLNVLISGLLAIPELRFSNHENCGFYHTLKSDVTKIADLRLPTDRLRALQRVK